MLLLQWLLLSLTLVLVAHTLATAGLATEGLLQVFLAVMITASVMIAVLAGVLLISSVVTTVG